ncbi:GYDIA family GHMP kinase [uncultured Sunxiuqinia sp.]|uniref:GYDIA family GHMP kinase n=1 Tax=uncultured Sunxiuqinia sp. TaxID=1573825 RepID=UPI002AA70504|nr:GYDIA family GHMP kinase [uncultured Sunxiuqinia sp.]
MPDNQESYYAHGKLLLTAEYFVLQGAKAIALPVKYGQRMTVGSSDRKNELNWKAFTPDGLWFSCDLRLPDLEIIQSSDAKKADILRDTLQIMQQMNPNFQLRGGLEIQTRIDFDSQWGLGSSSTLIANLASWADVDPFQLNEKIFNGSGFDIACASADGPILYTKGEAVESVKLDYLFKDNLYFVYSGSKKSTRAEVRCFMNKRAVSSAEIEMINEISQQMAQAKNLDEFQQLMVDHEQLVSGLLDIPTVKSTDFADFEGEIKSLGAWGGDFYLVATTMNESSVFQYFKAKGLHVIFPWKELVLNNR